MTSPDLMPPPPRRTDDAFALSVQGDVAAIIGARSRWRVWTLVAVPTTALVAAAVLLTVGGGEPVVADSAMGSMVTARLGGAADAADFDDDFDDDFDNDFDDNDFAIDDVSDDDLVAFADVDLPVAFAFQELDGSSEQDLAAVEYAFDHAIRHL
jgi:hypothetical protein